MAIVILCGLVVSTMPIITEVAGHVKYCDLIVLSMLVDPTLNLTFASIRASAQ